MYNPYDNFIFNKKLLNLFLFTLLYFLCHHTTIYSTLLTKTS